MSELLYKTQIHKIKFIVHNLSELQLKELRQVNAFKRLPISDMIFSNRTNNQCNVYWNGKTMEYLNDEKYAQMNGSISTIEFKTMIELFKECRDAKQVNELCDKAMIYFNELGVEIGVSKNIILSFEDIDILYNFRNTYCELATQRDIL